MLNLPPLAELYNPVTITNIVNHQMKDLDLMRLVVRDSDHYRQETMQQYEVVVYSKEPNSREWKIVIPNSLIKDIMTWYHTILGHAGIEKLINTVGARFLIPKLRERAEEAIRMCPDQCQQYKPAGKGYGHLPSKIVTGSPWNEVALDLIGPWKIKLKTRSKKKIYEFMALTCIDPFSNLPEIIRINGKTSKHVSEQFTNLWLSRYPKPNRCIMELILDCQSSM